MTIVQEMKRISTARAEAAVTASDGAGTGGTCRTAVAFDDGDRYLDTTYRDGEFSESVLTRKEALERDHEDVDLYINEPFGEIAIQPKDGARLRYRGEIPGLGPAVGRPFLDALMWQPGEFLTAEKLILDPRLESLAGADSRAARLRDLRRGFKDSPSDGWFFILARRPWRIAFNARRSFRLIERLAQAESRRPRTA
jgi:hypothetical protein